MGGTHSTSHTYLLGEIVKQASSAPNADNRISLALLGIFFESLPDEARERPLGPFVLSMSGFNYLWMMMAT
jgi:hypothetical protein